MITIIIKREIEFQEEILVFKDVITLRDEIFDLFFGNKFNSKWFAISRKKSVDLNKDRFLQGIQGCRWKYTILMEQLHAFNYFAVTKILHILITNSIDPAFFLIWQDTVTGNRENGYNKENT